MKEMTKGKKLLSILLSLVMLLSLMPASAHATGEAYPNNVTVNNGVQLSGAAFFKNGDTTGNLTGSATDYNARYDSATGILELKNYQGGTIATTGNTGKTTTIKISGANSITDSRNGIFAAGGDSVVITSDEEATLNITITGTADYDQSIAGIRAYIWNSPHGSVTIKGNVNLIINVTTASSSATANAIGIYAAEEIKIEDNATVTVKCTNQTNNSTTNVGLFTETGSNQKITFDTTKNISVDVSETNGYSFAVRSGSYAMTKADLVTLKWNPGVANNGGKIYGGNDAFDASNWAINIDDTNHMATYKYGTPYTVDVFGANPDRSQGKYVENETVALTAVEAYKTKFGFKKWASNDVTITNPESETTTFTMPNKNVNVTAYYNIFTTEPKFERLSDNSGKITYVLKETPSRVKWCNINGDQVDTFGTSINGNQEIGTFRTPAGTYYIEFTIADGVYRSEPIVVDYSDGAHPHACSSSTVTLVPAKAATCIAKGNVEYWSCSVCHKNFDSAACTNELTNIEIAVNPDNHTGTRALKHDADGHWYEWDCCDAVDGTKGAHVYDDDADKDCNICGYERTLHIAEAVATMTIPEAGDGPSAIVFSVPDGANYTAELHAVYLAEDPYPDVTDEAPFEAGKTYDVRVYFKAAAGYAFDSDTVFKVNDRVVSLGWGADYGKQLLSITIAEPVTSYTVTFAGGEGATGTAPVEAPKTAGTKFNLPACSFTKEGYTFDGWSDGTNVYPAGAEYTMPAANVVFTATWKENAHVHTLTLVKKVEPTHFAEGKEAYYSCSCGKNYEDAAGTVEIADIDAWGIIPVTDHEMSGWKHDDANHWKECTIEGCTHKAEEGAHAGGTATCTEKATCATCGEKYGELAAHNHGSEWEHDTTEHWHECECGDRKDAAAHTPGPDATEDTPQTCTVCGYVIKAALGHVCADNLTLVEKKEATHFEEGKEAYYGCTCGKYYEDAAGTVEITDIGAWGIIPKTDHAASEWMSDENNHWHECTIQGCDEKTEPEAHSFEWIIDREATGTEAGSKHEECSVCGYKKAAVEIPAAGSGAGQDTPQTGDNGMMLMWIALLFVSLGGAAGVTVLKKRGFAKK